MSHFIVMPFRPNGNVQINGSTILSDKVARDCSKLYWTDKQSAMEDAKALAKKYPQIQFVVFEPGAIFETLPPAEPKLLQKRITSSGEIVLDKGD